VANPPDVAFSGIVPHPLQTRTFWANDVELSAMRSIRLLALILGLTLPSAAFGQGDRENRTRIPDEFREILKEVEDAYENFVDVDKDVLEELRKQYREPKPDREAKIFREIRKLYNTTPQDEEAILREIRLAYQQQSAEQEARVFYAIRRAERLPPGTVPVHILAEEATKLFRKFDVDRDGLLAPDELSENLYTQRGRWDQNRDGAISFEEYAPYYQGFLKWVSDGVASGEIKAKLPRGFNLTPPDPGIPPRQVEAQRPVRAEPAKATTPLPEWFTKSDLDADGQVGLYEWKKSGQPIKHFLAMDRNSDGFLVAEELRRFLAEQSTSGSGG
jgi:hypothetical protein